PAPTVVHGVPAARSTSRTSTPPAFSRLRASGRPRPSSPVLVPAVVGWVAIPRGVHPSAVRKFPSLVPPSRTMVATSLPPVWFRKAPASAIFFVSWYRVPPVGEGLRIGDTSHFKAVLIVPPVIEPFGSRL